MRCWLAVLLTLTHSATAFAQEPTEADKPDSEAAAVPAGAPIIQGPEPGEYVGADGHELAAALTATARATEATAKATERSLEFQQQAATEAQFEELQAGNFIQYGVTAGYAFVLHTASLDSGTDGAKQKSFAVTTMPYVRDCPRLLVFR